MRTTRRAYADFFSTFVDNPDSDLEMIRIITQFLCDCLVNRPASAAAKKVAELRASKAHRGLGGLDRSIFFPKRRFDVFLVDLRFCHD